MKITSGITAALLLTLSLSLPALAWDPPDGPAIDQADPPATPTTLVPKAHGYIIQNGINVLYNDGYWFAAAYLRGMQQELLNGVRYADVYQGCQAVDIQICEFWGISCQTVDDLKDWPYAADNHYFNPATGQGLQAGYLSTAATWGPYIPALILSQFTAGLAYATVDVNPSLASVYPSALSWFGTEYANATSAFTGGAPLSIGGRQGNALAVFYLGWASHFMQDQFVVHHTMDEVLKHHAEYEASADGLAPSVAGVGGIYPSDAPLGTRLTQASCPDAAVASRTCLPDFAARTTNSSINIDVIDGGDYSSAVGQVQNAAALQAGLYWAFLNDVGSRPVHMSAVMPGLLLPLQ